MTKIEDRCHEVITILNSTLYEPTGNSARVDAERIIACHEELAQLHNLAMLGVTHRSAKRHHQRTEGYHLHVAKLWTDDLTSGGLIQTFGESKSLRWVFDNFVKHDNHGSARFHALKSRRAMLRTLRSKQWSDKEYAWRIPDLSPEPGEGMTCR
jgi:hypothetical protein